MGGFRIGRKFAQHAYPDPPRGAAALALARNFATGPADAQGPIGGGGVLVLWNAIDVGAAPSTDVPITPLSTGIVLISGVITISNGDVDQTMGIVINVNGSPLPVPASLLSTVSAAGSGGLLAFAFLAETTAIDTPVGVTANISVLVTGSNGTTFVLEESSSIEVQEVSVATG